MSVTETAVPSIPDHELLGRVGRGSYGEVWLARGVTGAYRAVKVVQRGSFSSDRPYDREFSGILKFEPVSRTHPGLVSILHVGRNHAAGHFYYVMEVADDVRTGQAIEPGQYLPKTLGEWLKQGPLPLTECIRVGLALSDALTHLHGANLVHRDIKPSNIIFVDGLPKLADIGLVTDIGEKATFVGTEGYIPPEGPGSPGADLFSLGRVLYEVSTGQRCEEFPELPTDFRQRPDAELFARFNAVVLKACDPRPAHRHETARELHDELAALTGVARVGRGPGASAEPPAAAKLPRALVVFETDDPRDARVAGLLEERLAAAGWRVLLNDSSEFGVTWARRFEAELLQTRVIIALLSETSVDDVVLNYRLDLAVRAAGGPSPSLRILPVRLAYTGPLPGALAFASAQWPALNWLDENDDEKLATEVLERLNAGAAA
jgi:hypothetical protein